MPSIVADYRASAGADIEHDTADAHSGERLSVPVTVLQQDWGSALGYDAAATWRRWSPNLEYVTVTSGHFMAEEAAKTVINALRSLLAR